MYVVSKIRMEYMYSNQIEGNSHRRNILHDAKVTPSNALKHSVIINPLKHNGTVYRKKLSIFGFLDLFKIYPKHL